jgi:O-antigen/teichoic acid export membrane protein
MLGRLFLGMGANLIGQVLNFAQRLLLVPLFLSAWGINVYSDWLQLTSLAAYFTLLDMGAQIYVINRLTQVFAVRDIQKFREYLHTSLLIFIALPGTAVIFFCAVVLVFPPSTFLKLAALDQFISTGVIIFVALQFAITLSQGLILGVYRAAEMTPRGFMLANLVMALQLAVLGGGLIAGVQPLALSILQIAPSILIIFYCIYDVNRRLPEFELSRFSAVRVATARSLLRPSLNFFSMSAAQALSTQGTILIVGGLLGSIALVTFSTQRTMANLLRQLLGFVVNSAWPELTKLDAEGKHKELAVLFRWVVRTTLISTVIAALALHFFGGWIYIYWLGRSLAYDTLLMDLFLAYVFVLVFWSVSANMLMAVNRHQLLSKLVMTASAFSIVAAWIGGRLAGLHGVAWGIFLNDVVLLSWTIPAIMRHYNHEFSPLFFLRELLPITLGALLVVILPLAAPAVAAAALYWWLHALRQVHKLSRAQDPAAS